MKEFPLQTQRDCPPGPRQIPWSVAEKAYGEYSRLYGSGQSLERLAERGGFGWGEMDKLYPAWRKEIDEICVLKNALRKTIDPLMDCEANKYSYEERCEMVKEIERLINT